jgi:hypothetical protein
VIFSTDAGKQNDLRDKHPEKADPSTSSNLEADSNESIERDAHS